MSERSVFLAALEIADPQARQAYLDEACRGNEPLRQRVTELLVTEGNVGSFLARPHLAGDATVAPITERAGTQIGPYKLMEQIGEGGFGLVFVAEQHEPVRRKVALKVIKPGMDSREVIARFEAERQALAMMDHPHIAKVLDAGTTAAGRPAEAQVEFEAAVDSYDALVFQDPTRLTFQIELGGSYCNVGIALQDRRKFSESLSQFKLACEALQPVYEQMPANAAAKNYLRNSHWNRAMTLEQIGRGRESVKDWDRTVALSPTAEQPMFRARRAFARLMVTEAESLAESVAEVAELSKMPNWPAPYWFNFARVFAIAGNQLPDKQTEYFPQAVQLLNNALKAGLKDADNLNRDHAFDPLREREDFRQVLNALEAAKSEKQ